MLTIDLHPYQEPALDMLISRESLLLAMDMGTGKTITSIAMAEHLLGEGEITTALIVAPSGLLIQWAEALADVTDVTTRRVKIKGQWRTLPEERWCAIVAGTPAQKRTILDQIRTEAPPYILASYDIAADNVRLLRRVSQMTIIDEVTALKGFRAARAKALRKLTTRFRLGLSGAPVENHRPEEAWAIMRWIDPDLFGDFMIFEQAYIRRNSWGKPVRYVNMDVLHRKLSSAMYRKRRTDHDVSGFLPAVETEVWEVNLDPATRVTYEQIVRDLDAELASASMTGTFDAAAYYGGYDDASGAGRVAAVHQVAQMLLVHPELVRLSAQSFVKSQNSAQKSGSAYAAALVASGALDGLVSTPKLDLLQRNVTKHLRQDDAAKAIIVSRYLDIQTFIAQRFETFGHVRYHGGLNFSAKAAAVARFETDPEVRIMIMSHAGAYGVDLPAADLLVKVDPPKSAGQDKQLSGRPVRASSIHQSVRVVNLCTLNTIEERDYDLLSLKDRVASAVTDGDGIDDDGVVKNSVESLTRHVADFLEGSAPQ